MKKITTFSILMLLVIALVSSVSLVAAYREDFEVKGPNYSEDRHILMQDAFNNLDYNSWFNIMSDSRTGSNILSVITADNFNIFAKAHEAGINGDYETANELRSELGLNNGNGSKDGSGYGMHKQNSKSNYGKGLHKQNSNSNFIDLNNDGVCDNLN